MAELAGTLGAGRVLVLQPSTHGPLALRVGLGLQRFWHRALKGAGRDTVRLVALAKVEGLDGPVPGELPFAVGDRMIAAFAPRWDPQKAVFLVAQNESRWGLVADLLPQGERVLMATTLWEVRGDTGRTVDAWRFDRAPADLPAHAVEILLGVGRRIGTRLPYSTATEAFDTPDPVAAMQLLEQLGVLGMAEDDCRLEIDEVLERLAELAIAAPRSRVVIELVPDLLGHLARLGAHDLQLAGWVRTVRTAIAVLPPEWEGLVGRSVRAGREPVS